MYLLLALRLVHIVSGILWVGMMAFTVVFLRTPVGSAFGIGGAAALIAFVLGLVVLGPAIGRATALAATLGSVATEEERAARAAEIDRLRSRAAAAGRVVALLLIVAAGAMAVARYV